MANEYMFLNKSPQPDEAYKLQLAVGNGRLMGKQVFFRDVWVIIDPNNGDYCYVFSDESALFRGPYSGPTIALEALVAYQATLL